MALRILYPGDRNALSTLASGAFTRQNFGLGGMTSGRITADTPDGALGGMVATYSDNYEVNIAGVLAGDVNRAIGVFLNDAAGSPFENTPTVASGKLTVMTSMGSYETDIYETLAEAGGGALLPTAYAKNVLLYCSKNGLLTTDPASNATVVGIVAKAPTATDPWLGFNLKV